MSKYIACYEIDPAILAVTDISGNAVGLTISPIDADSFGEAFDQLKTMAKRAVNS